MNTNDLKNKVQEIEVLSKLVNTKLTKIEEAGYATRKEVNDNFEKNRLRIIGFESLY